MLQQDSTIENVKYEVLLQVAKHTYRGDLEEVKEQLPYEMIPGPQALFRCCIYKEREIIRQRIRMAEGKSPVAGNTNRNTIHVITSACEGCPINRFVVTDNCQKCMSKRCQQACNFGAIWYRSSMVDVIHEICEGKKVYALIAPAGEGQFGKDISMVSIAKGCKELGFIDALEVAMGGDLVADAEAKLKKHK